VNFICRIGLADGFRYVWKRPDLKAVLVMLFLIGTFGLNFPIFIATMSIGVFHAGAGQYGLLTSIMAIGSVAGALLAAKRAKPDVVLLLAAAAIFGFGCVLAAIMPNYWLFGLALTVIGVSAQSFTIATNSFVQLSTEPVMRGRVIAILLAMSWAAPPSGRPSSVGSPAASARAGRSASAPLRGSPQRSLGSTISRNTVTFRRTSTTNTKSH